MATFVQLRAVYKGSPVLVTVDEAQRALTVVAEHENESDKTTKVPFSSVYAVNFEKDAGPTSSGKHNPRLSVHWVSVGTETECALLTLDQLSILDNHSPDKFDDASNEALETAVDRLRALVVPNHASHASTRVHAFINPASGRQQARDVWSGTVAPMLSAAGFTVAHSADGDKLIETRADGVRQQARDLAQKWVKEADQGELAHVHLVLCLGGDGTVHDLVNGFSDVLEKQAHKMVVQLGVIPCGSGNAFALSLGADQLPAIQTATLKVVRGDTKPFFLMDVSVCQVDKAHAKSQDWADHVLPPATQDARRLLLVVMSWGFHAQIVAKARYLRYIMGNRRFSLVAMLLLLFMHQYQGDLVLKHAQKYNRDENAVQGEKQTIALSSKDPEGGFTYFLSTKQSSLEPGFNVMPLASPFSHDMDILCMRNATADQLKEVAGLAFQGGKHMDHPSVHYYKAKELLLRVHQATDLCLDGEVVAVNAMDVVHLKLVDAQDRNTTFTVFV
ncbi:ATP-NAD kinase-like domain-containing protein [Gongronella butleri]|nr:ATP-NAD kinase-like domain-containing protein [Gongronella butleri]